MPSVFESWTWIIFNRILIRLKSTDLFCGTGELSGPRLGNWSHGLCYLLQLYSTLPCTSDADEGPFATHIPNLLMCDMHRTKFLLRVLSIGPNIGFFMVILSFYLNLALLVTFDYMWMKNVSNGLISNGLICTMIDAQAIKGCQVGPIVLLNYQLLLLTKNYND